ncbi:hypothetical protein GGX14DRAFT_542323 [Mycena pura]|uniref:Uncharacterized protein n=1 Tax=Mycena pura TaxID=153505 RepID=A0AAD6VM86_9AGAR|nr:hypothetical protein GGX14DRAFT_542323 [Mycena pura]
MHSYKSHSDNTSPHDEDSTDSLLNSAISLLGMSHKGRSGWQDIHVNCDYNGAAAPKRSWFTTSKAYKLRLSSLILHSALVAMHLALVGIWARGIEHRFTVALENEKVASFIITATSTAFGTIYSAILVFVTQALSRRQSLQMDQVLTATHDNAAAWAGIGAALLHLWYQKAVRASTSRTLTATLYLMTISGLHITISSLFSLVTFNSSRSFVAATRGLPAFNGTLTTSDAAIDMSIYAFGSLYFLPTILDGTTSLGLQDGSLYDVLDITGNVMPGNATVNASGFNITCGSVPEEDRSTFEYSNNGEWANLNYAIPSTRKAIHSDQNAIPDPYLEPGIISAISTAYNWDGSSDWDYSIILYSTIPIVDSSGKSESWVDVSPPMNTSVSSVQLLQCSLTLVRQLATIDAQSQKIQTITPSFRKNCSTWLPYTAPYSNVTTNGNQLIDQWAAWYNVMPQSDLMFDYNEDATPQFISVADMYLIQRLNLPAANHSDTKNLTLHDLENALSTLVASMFWTLGHIPPTHRPPSGPDGIFFNPDNGTSLNSLADIPPPPILLPGKGEVVEIFAEARVELNIIAVSAGLAASMILMMLALTSLLSQRGQDEDDDLPLDGTGILHAIWLYRNHPELETLLEQVERPTDENLRAAGMVKTRLLGKRVCKDE